MAIPLELMPWSIPQFLTATPSPYAGYFLVFYQAGTTTPQNVYSDSLGNTSLGSEVILDATGYPSDGSNPVSIFLLASGYKVALCPPLPNDATSPDTANPVRTVDTVENVGQTYIAQLGTLLSAGQKSAADGYTVTANDIFVSFLGSATGVLNLPDVTMRTQPVIVQVIGSISCVVTSNSAQTFNNTAATTFTIASGTTPKWPVVIFLPYPTDGTWLVAGGLYTS